MKCLKAEWKNYPYSAIIYDCNARCTVKAKLCISLEEAVEVSKEFKNMVGEEISNTGCNWIVFILEIER